MRNRARILALALTCAGCAPHLQVQGWPQLAITVDEVAPEQISSLCRPDGWTLWQILTLSVPLACTWINLEAGTCRVIVPADPPGWLLEHELEHCAGWAHDDRLQQAYDLWLHKKN
jgi:hypothetical protein